MMLPHSEEHCAECERLPKPAVGAWWADGHFAWMENSERVGMCVHRCDLVAICGHVEKGVLMDSSD